MGTSETATHHDITYHRHGEKRSRTGIGEWWKQSSEVCDLSGHIESICEKRIPMDVENISSKIKLKAQKRIRADFSE